MEEEDVMSAAETFATLDGIGSDEAGGSSGCHARLSDDSASHDLQPGDIVSDRYVIDHIIGCGGHGAIHRARHRELDLPVAVKVLHLGGPEHVPNELAQRFVREAKLAAQVRHRNVLSVHDTGRLPDGSPYIVMELIEGADLEARIARGPLSIPAIVDLGRQLFSGLTAIAEANVLHRDVKPANVMLHREMDGQVLLKLVDFGIARSRAELERLTVTGAIVGTPHYMSPEQLRGEVLDARADMYAASAVLYEALTGRPPFDGEATALVIGQILSATATPVRTLRPDCPEALEAIVMKGLARKRADRPSHPMQVVAALDALARAESLPTGALAWTGDVGLSPTMALDLSRRRVHTPNRPPVEEPEGPVLPVPIEEPDPALEPERPDRIDDPPPQMPPRRAGWRPFALGATAIAGLAAVAWAMPAPAPTAAEPPAPSSVERVALVSAVTPVSAAATQSETERLLQQGLEALARGEVDAALAHYRAAAEASPERVEAQRGRGVAAARAGLDDEAIAAYERYLAMAPDASDAERVRERLADLRTHRSERLTHRSARRPRRTHH
jgi:serine/threonine protein kinase